MRQSYPNGEGDASHLYSADTDPRGVPAYHIAKPELLRPLYSPIDLAISDSSRGPSRDRPG